MYHSNSKRLPSPEELRKKYKVKFYVTHFHRGNDPDNFRSSIRRKTEYATICRIKNEHNQIVGIGVSACSSKDAPSRRTGHEIAVGRAIKDFIERRVTREAEDRKIQEEVS